MQSLTALRLGEDIDFPNLPSNALLIGSVAFAEGVTAPALPNYKALIESVKFAEDVDYPNLPSYEVLIGSVKLAEGVNLPTIRIAATAVVGAVTGGQGGEGFRGTDNEDPEDPPLGSGLEGAIGSLSIDPAALSAISPVQLSAVIKPTLDLSNIPQPIQLSGIIQAQVQYLTGAGGGGGGGGGGGDGGGGGAEDPVQRSALAQDISTIARTVEAAAVSGNLDPSLGPTPSVDIPSILDKLNQQTNFSDDQAQRENPGFGDILRSVNQFRQEAGGSSGGVSGALRVTFPPEVFAQLAQESTLQAGFIFANDHLRAFLANEAGLATEATLAQIQSNTERIADAPLVQQLVDAGVAFPNDPTDPVNAIFTESPIHDFLGRGGLSLFAGFDAIKQNLETLQGAGDAPNLMQIGSAENPGFFNVLNYPEKQEITGKVEVTNKVQIEGNVNAKQVGTFAVTQGGEFVVQLASGGTLPVIVQGGQMTVQISGGLEQLAVELDEIEVALRAVGALT